MYTLLYTNLYTPNPVQGKIMVTRSRRYKTKNNQAEEAKESIQLAIASGRLRPNQRIIESEIADKLGMSRTPVREALKQLEVQGYITRLPKRGLIVTEDTPDDIRSLFEIREALEGMAAKLACQRATRENIKRLIENHDRCNEAIAKRDIEQFIKCNWDFHDEILSASGNKLLASHIQNGRDRFFPLRVLQLFQDAEWRATAAEHQEILEAICQRSQAKAEKAVRKHLKMSARLITRHI
jgi:DNA-binding GntR family transcriptional regulator